MFRAVGVVGEALEVSGQRVEQRARLRRRAQDGQRREPQGDVSGPVGVLALLGQLLNIHQDGLLLLLGDGGVTRLQLELDLALF